MLLVHDRELQKGPTSVRAVQNPELSILPSTLTREAFSSKITYPREAERDCAHTLYLVFLVRNDPVERVRLLSGDVRSKDDLVICQGGPEGVHQLLGST